MQRTGEQQDADGDGPDVDAAGEHLSEELRVALGVGRHRGGEVADRLRGEERREQRAEGVDLHGDTR